MKQPILSENPHSSVSALEAQREYFQPRVTSIHTSFTQQEPEMLSSHLGSWKKAGRLAVASSPQSGVYVGSTGCWASHILTWWQVYLCLLVGDLRWHEVFQRCFNSETLQIHESYRKLKSPLISGVKHLQNPTTKF